MLNSDQEVVSAHDLPEGSTYGDALRESGGTRKQFAALVNGTLRGLYEPVQDGDRIEPVDFAHPAGEELYRHSTAHIMASAVAELFPNVKYAIGPAIKDGFFYDFETERPFTEDDLAAIEKKMKEIVKRNERFGKSMVTREQAIQDFDSRGDRFKVEILEGIEDPEVSVYQHGEFVDLCRGPHLPSTGYLKAFKLLSVAGSYSRGDSNREQLQRIYGTSWDTKQALADYLHRLEEAKRRDHRKLGKELDLFSLHEDVGGGLVFWHPRGARIRKVMEDYWREAHTENGYEIVFTPHVGRSTLWETSGHLEFYKESMYPQMEMDQIDFFVKPMNCPFHIKIYKNSLRSYRDLPMRWAELGTVYRYELPGVLHGLLRVRGFTQDDAHLFVTPDQVDEEIDKVLNFCLEVLRTFGFEEFELFLSTRPEKAVGEPEDWKMAEEALQKALDKSGLAYGVDEGGGAFYGPKIDIKITDAIGRSWQCSTIQFDFNLPERFDMNFIGEDGKAHRPFMIHRALMGSLERFFGVLIEHYAGAFPVWLAPTQVRVLPISQQNLEYAESVAAELKEAGVRVEVDARNEKVGAKIRDAELQKDPYMLVVGRRDEEAGTVAVRRHGEGDLGAMSRAEFKAMIVAEDANRENIAKKVLAEAKATQ
ncbi:MAG: threonine--tRNA ligase [Candidatus Eisenbacteria bacterium]|uniref:Threonine--tRNA ligase n=1 Tax=Eiseniibacteriota bacterium TaxID=2212470 RepID=A0A7Y2EDY0_UNCEI|nr:threonine--tRNA ligase [Candidatus Eisenbacteria bacterium]